MALDALAGWFFHYRRRLTEKQRCDVCGGKLKPGIPSPAAPEKGITYSVCTVCNRTQPPSEARRG